MSEGAQTHRFEAEVSQVLRLVIHSLYSNPEIFLRELVSNASDALDKLRYRALTDHALASDAPKVIRIACDEALGTITIEDFGVGMTADELKKNLGTVAHSGSRAFLEAIGKAKQGGDDALNLPNLVGQFGVGFYSAYLVADRVDVVTRAAGANEAWRWSSTGENEFTIEAAERAIHGTAVTLHVREDKRAQFVSTWKLRELVERYSDYIAYPIELYVERWDAADKDASGDEDDAPETPKAPTKRYAWDRVNRAVALWQRTPSEVKPEEYTQFYQHLTHDFEPPLAHAHFKVEGTRLFNGLLFVASRPPFDLYSFEQRHGVRLYVKRVFIMDEVKELLPPFLRFVRGVVDSDDLPLNVSREILQDSADVRFIQKQVAKKALEMLERLANEKPDDYAKLWKQYGAVIKEGLHSSPEHKERLAKLVRFKSTQSAAGFVSLAEYKARMPGAKPEGAEGADAAEASDATQKAIYYVIAESEQAAARSPHLEALLARNYEVLLLTDPIDEWAIRGLDTYEGLQFVSAMKAELGLAPVKQPAENQANQDQRARAAALLIRFREVLGDRVSEVRESTRLTTSPACLVVPEGGMHAHMERLLKATQASYEGQKRILEVNTLHPLVQSLAAVFEKKPTHDEIGGWIEVLYTQALLSEGSHVEDPSRFATQVTRLLEGAAARAVSELGPQ